MKKYIYIIILISIIILIGCQNTFIGDNNNLNISQIIEHIDASAAKYQSLNATIAFEQRHFQNTPDDKAQELIANGEKIDRFTNDRSFSKVKTFNDKDKKVANVIQITSPVWFKQLKIYGNHVQAEITNCPKQVPKVNSFIYQVIWHGAGFSKQWKDYISDPTIKASYNGKEKLWLIERTSKSKNTLVRWVSKIDPLKDFIPVGYEVYKNGELIMYDKFEEFVQNNALWIPTKLQSVNQTHVKDKKFPGTMIEYKISNVEVNKAISADQLDVMVPSGTLIDDKIVGSSYVINESKSLEMLGTKE